MTFKLTTLSAAAALALVGCQSTTSGDSAQPEKTNHLSQSVYEVEFSSAQTFKSQSQLLAESMRNYCESSESIEALKGQWHQTMVSWMALQGQERGPEAALAQSWNIQFWPDKKNTTGRKMSQLTQASECLD